MCSGFDRARLRGHQRRYRPTEGDSVPFGCPVKRCLVCPSTSHHPTSQSMKSVRHGPIPAMRFPSLWPRRWRSSSADGIRSLKSSVCDSQMSWSLRTMRRSPVSTAPRRGEGPTFGANNRRARWRTGDSQIARSIAQGRSRLHDCQCRYRLDPVKW